MWGSGFGKRGECGSPKGSHIGLDVLVGIWTDFDDVDDDGLEGTHGDRGFAKQLVIISDG